MKVIPDSSALTTGLDQVGLTAGEPISIGSDAVAKTWSSDYAELYLVDAATLSSDQMPELLSRLDSVVAKRLRQQRDKGRFLDAHVCILVNASLIEGGQLARESDASRFVSRKYWIDRDFPVEEILRRLTLTWVDVDVASVGEEAQQLEEFTGLRKRIADRMGTGAAIDFLEAPAT